MNTVSTIDQLARALGTSRTVVLAAIAALFALLAYSTFTNRAPAPAGSISPKSSSVVLRAATLQTAIRTSLSGIADETSAMLVLPQLRAHAAALLDVRDMAEMLPPSGRKELAAQVQPWLSELQALVAAALKAPTIATVVKPVLDQILQRMAALAKG